MPELPDIEAYRAALAGRAVGSTLKEVRLRSFFLLRTVEPPLSAFEGRRLQGTRRLGKRLVLAFGAEPEGRPALYLVLHLMLAGRLSWRPVGSGIPAKRGLAAFDFEQGTLLLTESGSQKMASMHAIVGDEALSALDPKGLELSEATAATFAHAMRKERHTLKLALTSPRLVSGIGGAYADEILHEARLSPVSLTTSLSDAELECLMEAARGVLARATRRFEDVVAAGRWPNVDAFRSDMAVHGRYGQACPRCGDPVQRIRYATRETNYCATCQTGGVVLADRALSRLLGADWPRSLEAWEARVGAAGKGP